MATTMSSGIGESVLRKEDAPLIVGQGRYVDDIKLPGMAFAAFARSPHAHAVITQHRQLGGRGHARRRQGDHLRHARPRGRRPVRLQPLRQRRAAQAADPGRRQGAHGRRAGRARRRRVGGGGPRRRRPHRRRLRPAAGRDRRRERRQARRAAAARGGARQPLPHDRAQDRGLRRRLRRRARQGLADDRQPAPDAGARSSRAAWSPTGSPRATSSRSTPRRRCRTSCARSCPRSAASPRRRCA